MPTYSGLPRDKWLQALQKESFIKELWPAQHLLGQADVLKGESAIVQMPTSAGKTKATELILRSAFLAERVSLAIIIAPFRALCHEIKNSLVEAFHNEPTKVDELSDALQTDFKIAELLGHQQILVVTPRSCSTSFGTLRNWLPTLACWFLMKATSSTAAPRHHIRAAPDVVCAHDSRRNSEGADLSGHQQRRGCWRMAQRGAQCRRRHNPDSDSSGRSDSRAGSISWEESSTSTAVMPNKVSFSVPRVIERFNLGRKKGKDGSFFPEKTDGQAIALYLGLKLVPNGSIAVFCGGVDSGQRL